MDINQARDLLLRYQSGNCTQAEKELVENWYHQLGETGEWQWKPGEKEHLKAKLEARLLKGINKASGTPLRFLWPKKIYRIAAIFLLLLGAAFYWVFFTREHTSQSVAQSNENLLDFNAPQSNKATITLASGQKVYLDSTGSGALVTQANTALVKLPGGEIAYRRLPDRIGGQLQYNTLSNPRGSTVVALILTDGSKVWLNAGSSLVYPVTFGNTERKVSVIGEAYFEIAKDSQRPFRVSIGGEESNEEIEVLGTSFDVNAYTEEPDKKITLLEGSVRIRKDAAVKMLSPGQQVKLSPTGMERRTNVDVSQVIAWKDGYFWFNDTDIRTLMRQVARWYDVDVTFEGKLTEEGYTGKISRDVPFSKLLKVLELNGLDVRTEGKKVTVISKKN
jgi:transmembrane sensor